MASRRLLPPFLLPRFHTRSFWSSSKSESGPVSASSSSTTSNSKSSCAKQSKMTDRLTAVTDAVNERKLPIELRNRPNAVRSETDIVNVVERRIFQSMEEGQFENLQGKGKPLSNLTNNPHLDPAEETLYRILSRNNCKPEWVELNKEIREMIEKWRKKVNKEKGGFCEEKVKDGLMSEMKEINSKVLRYNLIVPFGRQMNGLKWEKEIAKLEENNL